MTRRYQKKKVGLRGWRRHGKGNVKNRRGSGNKGGRGNAGLRKQKWTYTVKYAKEHFGSRGFVRHGAKKEVPAINVWEIGKMAKEGKLKKEGDVYLFKFKGKVLGAGSINTPVKIEAAAATEKAIEKVKASGGELNVKAEEQEAEAKGNKGKKKE